MRLAFLFFAVSLLLRPAALADSFSELYNSNPQSMAASAPVPVSAPEPLLTKSGLPAEMVPLVTPPAQLSTYYTDIFAREYDLVKKDHTKTIKALAANMVGTGATFDLPGVLYGLGAKSVKPLGWDARKYDYPAGVSEYAKASLRHIIWWREWNYWWDKLDSREFKPTFEMATMIKYRDHPDRKRAEYEFHRLAGMYLWYSEAIGDGGEALIKKMQAAGLW